MYQKYAILTIIIFILCSCSNDGSRKRWNGGPKDEEVKKGINPISDPNSDYANLAVKLNDTRDKNNYVKPLAGEQFHYTIKYAVPKIFSFTFRSEVLDQEIRCRFKYLDVSVTETVLSSSEDKICRLAQEIDIQKNNNFVVYMFEPENIQEECKEELTRNPDRLSSLIDRQKVKLNEVGETYLTNLTAKIEELITKCFEENERLPSSCRFKIFEDEIIREDLTNIPVWIFESYIKKDQEEVTFTTVFSLNHVYFVEKGLISQTGEFSLSERSDNTSLIGEFQPKYWKVITTTEIQKIINRLSN